MDRYEAVVRYIGTGDYVPRIEKYADGDLVLYAEAASRIADLEAQLAASEARCAELDGAARADEQRLRDAAECAGVGWFGCDTPEVLADTIGALRVDLAAALARAEEAERQLAAIEDARCRHGWKGSKPESTSRIETPCPACGLKSLFIAAGNHLTCANLSCREPSPESWCAAALARAEEAEREKRMAMRLMRAREDRLTAIRDTVSQNKDDDLVRVEVAYFLDCPQSEIDETSTDAGILAALRQAEEEESEG